jgi:hypothetical protein
MSRLDDELKIAFKREQPSPDFVARVLARLDEPLPQRRSSFWHTLVSIFEAPRLRWAIAAAAMLVIAIVSLWQLAPRQPAVDTRQELVSQPEMPASDAKGEDKTAPEIVQQDNKRVTNADNSPDKIERKVMPVKHRSRVTARRAVPKVDPEAEAAKQKVLFALQIANDAFSDVQRAIQNESHKPNTEPERNR